MYAILGIVIAVLPSMVVARKYYSKYDFGMERITITIDKKTLSRIKAIVGPRGVSKFLTAAAKDRLGRHALYAWLDEMDAKYGKPSKKLEREIDRDARKIFGIK